MKKIKQHFNSEKVFKGAFVNLGSAIASEIVGNAGFDFTVIDLEHGIGNESDILGQLQAQMNGTAASIIRVEGNERQRVHRVLDLGAEGIMFPHLKTVAEAQEAINAMRYSPEGSRGVAKLVRAANFGKDFEEYHFNQKKDLIGIIQVETLEIIDNLEEIAHIDGVDVLFVGPGDMTMALGVYGEFDHPEYKKVLKLTANAANKAGKMCGALLTSIDQFNMYYELGYRFFTLGADISFLNNGAMQSVNAMNEAITKVKS